MPRHPPARDEIPSFASLGVELHPDTMYYVEDGRALADSLGGKTIKDVFSNPLVFVAALSASMGGLLFGFDQGILSIVLTMDQFLAVFPETDKTVNSSAGLNKGVMTGLLELGAFLGALAAGFLADRYSRKRAIAIGAFWFIFGSVIQAASFSFAQLVVGRFIGGIGIGILSSTAPMYISEIAAPNIRGALLALESLTIVGGIVIMFYITYGSRDIQNSWAFRLPFTVQIVPVVFLGIGMLLLPYSPRWLAHVGRDTESLQALCTLRRLPPSDPRVQAEWITIRADAIRAREVVVSAHPTHQDGSFASEAMLEVHAWLDMLKPKLIGRTSIGILLMMFQQLQGVNALIYYSPTLFETLGLDYELQIDLSGALNCVQLAAIIFAFFTLDHVGRRPPLWIGGLLDTIFHMVTAIMIGKYSHDWPAHKAQGRVGVVMIFCFIFSYGMGWAPIPWAIPSEILATSVRAKGVAYSVCSNWFFNFIIGLVTPPMIQNIGYGTFVFFGASALLSTLYAWFFVPETKGKTLEEIDSLFKDNSSQADEAAREEIFRIIIAAAGAPRADSDVDKPVQAWIEKV